MKLQKTIKNVYVSLLIQEIYIQSNFLAYQLSNTHLSDNAKALLAQYKSRGIFVTKRRVYILYIIFIS